MFPDPCRDVVDVKQRDRPLEPAIVHVPAGLELWHVGHDGFPFASYNSRPDVQYRFSPLLSDHQPVGVIYAAESKRAAVAETVWRGLPLHGGRVPLERVNARPVGTLRTSTSLRLVELHDPGLRLLGLRPINLTDTHADCYPHTRAFAQALCDDHDAIDGFVWMSSRFNQDKAYLLIRREYPQFTIGPHALFGENQERDDLIDMSRQAGIEVTLMVGSI